MNKPLYLICCETLRQEICRQVNEHDDRIHVSFYSADCSRSGLTYRELRSRVKPVVPDQVACVVVGGPCLACIKNDEDLAGAKLYRFQSCFDILAGQTAVQYLTESGAHLITPGWLAEWRKHLAEWGFDQETAQQFFQESVNRLILMQTYREPDQARQLKEFSEYLGIPYEILPVGPDMLQLWIAKLLAEWQLDSEQKTNLHYLGHAMRNKADVAMIIDLVSDLATAESTAVVAQRFIDLAKLIFAAEWVRVTTL